MMPAMATPDGLDPAQSAVLLIDVQERLVAAMDDTAMERVVRAARALAIGASALDVPIVVTEQYPKGLGPTIAALEPHLKSATFVEKTLFDASQVEAVAAALKGRTHVIVAGLEAHICVHQTVRGLAAAGFDVHVVSDATCSRSQDHLRLAEEMWRRSGAHVSCAETVLFDWLGKAGGEAFKTISAAIR